MHLQSYFVVVQNSSGGFTSRHEARLTRQLREHTRDIEPLKSEF
jgi:hypothetical protein